jgi:murein DD-endopeptidase MepM/ murein hydrolase activator NlpD
MKRERRPRRKKLLKKLKSRFRLTVLNENTFEERFSYSLTPMNLIVMFGGLLLVFGFIIYLLVAFTPLKVYLVPGYVDIEYREQARDARIKADSLARALKQNQAYLESVQTILAGDIVRHSVDTSEMKTTKLEWTEADSLYDIEMRSKKSARPLVFSRQEFIVPLRGQLLNNSSQLAYGVDIVAVAGTPVLGVADGRVISLAPVAAGGYQMVLSHGDGWVSIYRNLGQVTHREGDLIFGGDAVGVVSASNNKKIATHLHLELWHSGQPVDASKFITR